MDANTIAFLQALTSNEAQDVWQQIWQFLLRNSLIIAVLSMGVALSMLYKIITTPDQDFNRLGMMAVATIVMFSCLIGHFFKEQKDANYSLTDLNTEIVLLKQNQPTAYNQGAADYVTNAYKQCYVGGYDSSGGHSMQCPKLFFFDKYLTQLESKPTASKPNTESNWWKYLLGAVAMWAVLSMFGSSGNKQPKPE